MECEKAEKTGLADTWHLEDEVRDGFEALFASEEELKGTVPEVSEGVSYTEKVVVEEGRL